MKRQLTTLLLTPLLLVTALTAVSCGRHAGHTDADHPQGDTLAMMHARLLTIVAMEEGETRVTVRNPWDTTRVLHRYRLIPKSQAGPEAGREVEGWTIVRTPLERAGVYSSVHCALMEELGRANAVAGVCEPEYVNLKFVQEGLRRGTLVNLGSGLDPNLERIMDMKADALLANPFEHSGGYGRLEQLGIAIIECADYMEPTPLGRAEWMRFYGRLLGRGRQADSLYSATARRYGELRRLAQGTATRPMVLSEMPQGGKWYVAGGRSTMGQLFADAGAAYAFAHLKAAGSVTLSMEQVLDRAAEARFWLIKHYGPVSRRQLVADNPSLALLGAPIWFCDTSRQAYYEETPFHPDLLLEDLIGMFHPETGVGRVRRYYRPLDGEEAGL